MDALRGKVFEINAVDAGAVVLIELHPWDGHDVVQLQGRVSFQFQGIDRLTPKGVTGGSLPALGIDLPGPFHHFKKPGPSGDSMGLEGGGYSQADGLLGPALVRHHQVGGEGVKLPLHTLDRGVERLQVDCNICPVTHDHCPPLHADTETNVLYYYRLR